MDEYAAQAKKAWGGTAAYREFEKKSRGRTAEEDRVLADGLMTKDLVGLVETEPKPQAVTSRAFLAAVRGRLEAQRGQ